MASEPATAVQLEEEQRLVEEAQAGHLDAMRPLLERYTQPLYGTVILPRLAPETIEAFVLAQLDRAGLGHNTFSPEALALIVRSGEGLLRRTRNLCLSSLIEAVRDQTRVVDLKQVNRVLIQPHWRKDCDQPLQ